MRILALLFLYAAMAFSADISGTWLFDVDLDSGGHGTPTFVLKQAGGKLMGTYKGPLGEQKVTGSVTGDHAEVSFEFEQQGNKLKVTYSAKIESAGMLSGTVKFTGPNGDGNSGKFTAKKQ